MKKHHAGMTMVEIMLVLVVGSFIVYFSLQQYLSYRYNADVEQVKANVDTLFQGMSAYYKAECAKGDLSPSVLNPIDNYPNVGIDIPSKLSTAGYLTQNFPFPISPIVNNSKGAQNYVAQFNLVLPLPQRQVCVSGVSPSGFADTTNCTVNASSPVIGLVVAWKIQIAVYLNVKNMTEANDYMNLLGADCLSSLSGDYVLPCKTGSGSGYYAVWERLPSYSNVGAPSPNWVMTPTVAQFTEMYSNNPVPGATQQQYIVCGN